MSGTSAAAFGEWRQNQATGQRSWNQLGHLLGVHASTGALRPFALMLPTAMPWQLAGLELVLTVWPQAKVPWYAPPQARLNNLHAWV